MKTTPSKFAGLLLASGSTVTETVRKVEQLFPKHIVSQKDDEIFLDNKPAHIKLISINGRYRAVGVN